MVDRGAGNPGVRRGRRRASPSRPVAGALLLGERGLPLSCVTARSPGADGQRQTPGRMSGLFLCISQKGRCFCV